MVGKALFMNARSDEARLFGEELEECPERDILLQCVVDEACARIDHGVASEISESLDAAIDALSQVSSADTKRIMASQIINICATHAAFDAEQMFEGMLSAVNVLGVGGPSSAELERFIEALRDALSADVEGGERTPVSRGREKQRAVLVKAILMFAQAVGPEDSCAPIRLLCSYGTTVDVIKAVKFIRHLLSEDQIGEIV
jgi:hypothetical protein